MSAGHGKEGTRSLRDCFRRDLVGGIAVGSFGHAAPLKSIRAYQRELH